MQPDPHIVSTADLHTVVQPLSGAATDDDGLLELIGDARVVLLGEATHGTHEFYHERAAITKRLITEQGFTAVAVEADWPDAARVNRYVHGLGSDRDAAAALSAFTRFPTWMWRNTVVRDFVAWLRAHNDALPPDTIKTGWYGLDLYSLSASITAVLDYLDRVDPDAAQRARYRYGCFEHFGDDPQTYGYVASFNLEQSCEAEVVAQLRDLQRQAETYAQRDGHLAEDEYFFAEQNARLAKNAEAYYRTMFRGRVESWNLRDTHMTDTLDALLAHLERHGQHTRVVVWAHNSHLGDARATDLGAGGELNVGQLVRERYRDKAFLLGFSTFSGTVTAATDWGAPAERMRVRPALEGSCEALFHATGIQRFLLPLGAGAGAVEQLRADRLERAIGVIYRPQTERLSHYFHARLPEQFDVLIHIDSTRAVEPLEPAAGWVGGEPPETFPTGQ
jgi:erythromycin esterase-like protein